MKIQMGDLKAAAGQGIDLYLRREDAILRVLFFVLMLLAQILLMIGTARHQAAGGSGFPLGYLFIYAWIADILFRYNMSRAHAGAFPISYASIKAYVADVVSKYSKIRVPFVKEKLM